MAVTFNRNWMWSKISLVLIIVLCVVAFSRIVSYIIVESVSMDTFDKVALSMLRSFLNDTQYENVVHNMQVSSHGEAKNQVRSNDIEEPTRNFKNDIQGEESTATECAVCKHVLPPLFRLSRT